MRPDPRLLGLRQHHRLLHVRHERRVLGRRLRGATDRAGAVLLVHRVRPDRQRVAELPPDRVRVHHLARHHVLGSSHQAGKTGAADSGRTGQAKPRGR